MRDRLVDRLDAVLITGAMTATLLLVAVAGWVLRRLSGQDPSPLFWGLLACVPGVLALWHYRRWRAEAPSIRLGLRGERMVGRMLERLRADGYDVFHDLPGDGFNVDHVLVGPGGVFAVETKTISKPRRGRAEVRYDGQRVLLNGHAPDRDPIAQARASADHVRDLLQRMTGRTVHVRPVVLYPGWWVEPERPDAQVWVLNPDRLAAHLKRQPARLPREDVALYADRLTLHLSTPSPA